MRARPSRAARRPVIARSIATCLPYQEPPAGGRDFCATGRRRLQSAPPWARLRAMSSRARLSAWLALATVVLPALAFAQDSIVPFGQEDSPRAHLRDRYRKPENSQKLSDSVRRLKSEDVEERLDAIRTLGQIDDPKATEALVAAASDLDMRVRIKAIDALGHVKAKDAPPLLVRQLFMRDTDLGTKQRILASLGKIGDKRATGPIMDFLSRNVDPRSEEHTSELQSRPHLVC